MQKPTFAFFFAISFLVGPHPTARADDETLCPDMVKRLNWNSMPKSASGQTTIRQEGKRLVIAGNISEDTYNQLKTFNLKSVDSVVLKSTGGLGSAAVKMAKLIRDNKLETRIEQYSVCLSACTLLFQSGTRRYMHSQSILGYHGASADLPNDHVVMQTSRIMESLNLGNPVKKQLNQSTAEFADALEKYGASKDLTDVMRSVEGDEMYCIDSVDAQKFKAAITTEGPNIPKLDTGMLGDVPPNKANFGHQAFVGSGLALSFF